jgi:hypothetical protein
VPFDELAYLESINSEKLIYKETNSYWSIKKDSILIDYERSHTKDYLSLCYKSGFDSTFYKIESDTLMIYNVLFTRGQCDFQTLSYLSCKNNINYLTTPEIVTVLDVEIVDLDTLVSTEGCEMVGAYEFKYKVPLSLLKNTDNLFFKGQAVIFK